jgi:hypothetical protein
VANVEDKERRFLYEEHTSASFDDSNIYLRLASVPTYANNAAALVGGLTAGMLYKTATGSVQIVY